jgi:hypothetical protein
MRKLVEIENSIVIPFDWRDPNPGRKNFGWAEFSVCMKFKRGKVSEFWVDPIQTHLEEMWHYAGGDIYFHISAYEGLQSQGAWRIEYCKTHKCTSISVYAPKDARFLEIDYHGLSFWKSDIRKWPVF